MHLYDESVGRTMACRLKIQWESLGRTKNERVRKREEGLLMESAQLT
jgi:hypothetical protein